MRHRSFRHRTATAAPRYPSTRTACLRTRSALRTRRTSCRPPARRRDKFRSPSRHLRIRIGSCHTCIARAPCLWGMTSSVRALPRDTRRSPSCPRSNCTACPRTCTRGLDPCSYRRPVALRPDTPRSIRPCLRHPRSMLRPRRQRSCFRRNQPWNRPCLHSSRRPSMSRRPFHPSPSTCRRFHQHHPLSPTCHRRSRPCRRRTRSPTRRRALRRVLRIQERSRSS